MHRPNCVAFSADRTAEQVLNITSYIEPLNTPSIVPSSLELPEPEFTLLYNTKTFSHHQAQISDTLRFEERGVIVKMENLGNAIFGHFTVLFYLGKMN